MKNHMRINGQLFQTNKKWSHLKEKQKTWIMETAWQEYDRFARERGKLPVHGSKQQLIEHIYEVMEAKGVWIPTAKSSGCCTRGTPIGTGRQAWPLFWINSKYLRLRLWKTSGNVANDERKSAKNP